MKTSSSKRRWAVAAVTLLALFLVRPGASRLKSRIILSISTAVGRPVDIGAVHIRLLPRPGFDLDNLVVYDDPAFSAEPMLRSSEVTAALRLTSLVRGRLEIARLDLTEPSLNLVHAASGHWNVESLLERTARIPLAPTAKPKLEPRPAFPYIEGASGRINFKNGAEKKPYALTNADFALWQESENSWGARLKAQPFRSDMNLNDTGLLQVSGTWQRADESRNTPLQASLEWNRAQVGQLTKLLTGIDQGWRGDLLLDMTFKGTPAKLQINGSASVDDFRRYDITSGQTLHMVANCGAEYSSITHRFAQLTCNAPVGTGLITLTGDMGWPGSHRYSLTMTADKVSASAMAVLAQRVKKNLPTDLQARGALRAALSIRDDGFSGAQAHWQGKGEISDFRLGSASNKVEIGAGTLPFAVANAPSAGTRQGAPTGTAMRFPSDARVEIGPFPLSMVRAGNLFIRGWINRSGYSFRINGDSDVGRMLRLGRLFGMPTTSATADGSAKLDLQIAGMWREHSKNSADFTGPQTVGSARLRNVQIAVRGLGSLVDVLSADMQLLPDAVQIEHLVGKAAGASWTGSMQLPRGCASTAKCSVHFALKANQLALAELNEWAHPGPKKRPWYRVLEATPEPRTPILANLHGNGQITADKLQIQKVQATHVSANVTLENGKLQISGLTADLLGGRFQGEWELDFTGRPSVCKGSGSMYGIPVSALSGAASDGWGGVGQAKYDIASTCTADFWRSAQGTVRVDVRNGTLPHLFIADDQQPLQFSRLNGQAQLQGGNFEIKDAKLLTPDGTYQVSGIASMNRQVDVKLTPASNSTSTGYTITGTLSSPRVAPITGAMQARLKSLPTK